METLGNPMSDRETGNLLAAIGNGESKAILLCVMRPNIIYDKPSLHNLLLDAQGNFLKEGWRMSLGVPFKYCGYSLAPLGLMAQEGLNPDLSEYGYVKREYGERIGIPFAGHMLALSEKYDASLFEVFGGTSSVSAVTDTIEQAGVTADYKKRSPIVRFKIFWEVLTRKLPLREADLITVIGEDQGILTDHLKKLSKFNLIDYDVVDPNRPYAYYMLADAEKVVRVRYRQHHGKITLKQHLYSIVISHPGEDLTYESLFRSFKLNDPDRQLTLQAFTRRVTSYLAEWSRDGFIVEGRFSSDTQSEINLTPSQRTLLDDYMTTLKRFQAGEPSFLEEGRHKAYEIISDPRRVAILMRKARNKSPHARRFYDDPEF